MHLLGTRRWGPPYCLPSGPLQVTLLPEALLASPHGRCTPHPTGFGLNLSCVRIPALPLAPCVNLIKFLFSANLRPHLENEDMFATRVFGKLFQNVCCEPAPIVGGGVYRRIRPTSPPPRASLLVEETGTEFLNQ